MESNARVHLLALWLPGSGVIQDLDEDICFDKRLARTFSSPSWSRVLPFLMPASTTVDVYFNMVMNLRKSSLLPRGLTRDQLDIIGHLDRKNEPRPSFPRIALHWKAIRTAFSTVGANLIGTK